MKQFDYSFEEALETTTTVCSYTNHTILREALEEWNVTRLESLLPRQYKIIQKLDQKFRNQILQRYPNDFQRENRMAIIDHGQVKMAHLSIFGSHKINGVAKLHSQILQEELFRDFYEMFPHKFLNVTNGVTQRRWLLSANPMLSEFITQRIGAEWVTKFETIEKLRAFASDKTSQDEFIAIKKANKKRFIDSFNYNHSRQGCIQIGMQEVGFEYQKAIFDVQIKRIHEYKRQLMNALHILMIYLEVKESKIPRKIPRLWIFAGKAAPGYELAKNIIRFIYCLSRKIASDPDVNKMMRIVYVENYNVSKAELIIPAADLSEQISTAGMEASGTGNMKLAMNGALTIGTDDGANVEMRESVHNEWWPFLFGSSAKENIEDRATGRYSPQVLCEQNPQIMQVVQTLVNHSLVENDVEQEALESIYRSLMEGVYGRSPDYHFVLKDLIPYYQTQKKVEDLYLNPSKWAEYAIHNMAGMSQFSTDISIKNYADKIWNISPCEIDLGELSRIRKEFSELDKCRIFP
jgi:starch phosphorylase